MIDYAEPLIRLRQMLRLYEELLLAKQWEAATELAPQIHSQLTLLTLTVETMGKKHGK